MRLVERERESAAVLSLVDAAVSGSGGVLVIEGPSGIGKSSLLELLADRARASEMAVRQVRATRLGGEVPFAFAHWLLEPAVRQAPSVLETGWARHARPLFDGHVSGGDPRSLIEGLVALVAALRRADRPLLLVGDDVQWADPGSLRFLNELAERSEDIGVAVGIGIGTGQGESDESLLRRLAAIAGRGRLTLAPLSAEAVRKVVLERLPEADEDFAERIAELAGGNPLLITELIDSAARHGTEGLRIPDGLGRMVLLRLDDAGAAPRQLAEAVAVLGETPLRLAAALAGLDAQSADRAADELVNRNVFVSGDPVRFAQPLVADALTAAIPAFELGARHRRAAELLTDDGVSADQIAGHLLRVRPGGERWVSETLCRAAELAMERGSPALAAQLLERALAEPVAPDQRGEILLRLAGARAGAGQPAAIESFEQALADVRTPNQRANAWHGLARLVYARGEFGTAAVAAARGRGELADGGPLAERLLAMELTAASSDPALAADASARLDALVGGAPPTEPTLLSMLITHQAARVIEIEHVPALSRRAVAADPLIDPESHGISLIYVAGALNFVDELVLAEELLDRGLSRALELGDPLAEVHVRSVRAWCRIYRGNLTGADDDLRVMLAQGELGWPTVDALCAMPLIVLRLELGDIDGARDALRRAPPGTQVGQAWFEGAVALAAGEADAALRGFEAAGAELEAGLGVVNPGVLPWRSSAALAAAQLGQLCQAQELALAELQQAKAAKAARPLGIALRVAGLVGEDPGLIEQSVGVLEDSPARLELAKSLTALGIAQRRAGVIASARSTLARSLDLAVGSGATALVERTATELRAAGARPRRRPRTGVDALTPSERQIAELAAAGRTTRQIAATLFLSPKTVEGHLTGAFRKLGISSRADLATLLSPRAAR